MTIPQDVAADPWQIVADLQQRIAASHAEREVLELALRDSEERYALAMQAINEGFYEWDVVTSEMRYSPRVCELVGLGPEELRTMADWTDRIHPTDMPEFRKAILAHFKGETEWLEAEYRYRHADGTWHWARQHGIGLRNDAGRVYRVVGSTGDITAQKAAEEALRESLEQQTATSEVLQVINSSPGDLTPVFDAMLERATRLCDAPCAMLWTYDGEAFSVPATFGVPEAFAKYLRKPLEIQPSVFLGALRHGETFVHNLDLADPDSYRGGNPLNRAVVDLGGARTGLLVPLQKDGRLMGAFRIYRHEVRPFTDKQIALLQNFAAQAVIAMENARLLTETREALEQQTAAAEVLQVINSLPGDLTPVFDAMLEKAMRLCDAAFGVLATHDEEYFRAVASRGVPAGLAEYLLRPYAVPPGSTFDELAAGVPVVQIPDVAADDRPAADTRGALIELGGARTGLAVALRKDDKFLGALWFYRQEVRLFTDKQIALLQNFAAQAVIAMENARLLGELRERTRDLEESLEYQTATSDVLKVISRSGAEVEPVLDTLVETAARLCEADKAMIYRLSDGLYRTAASFGFPPGYKAFIERNPITPSRGTLTGRTVIERRAVHIEDAAIDPEYTWAESQQLGNLRTLLAFLRCATSAKARESTSSRERSTFSSTTVSRVPRPDRSCSSRKIQYIPSGTSDRSRASCSGPYIRQGLKVSFVIFRGQMRKGLKHCSLSTIWRWSDRRSKIAQRLALPPVLRARRCSGLVSCHQAASPQRPLWISWYKVCGRWAIPKPRTWRSSGATLRDRLNVFRRWRPNWFVSRSI